MSYHLNTKRGYSFPAVSSAMQKAVRRGDAKLAGYWALELCASGFGQYVWRRLLTVPARRRQPQPQLHFDQKLVLQQWLFTLLEAEDIYDLCDEEFQHPDAERWDSENV